MIEVSEKVIGFLLCEDKTSGVAKKVRESKSVRKPFILKRIILEMQEILVFLDETNKFLGVCSVCIIFMVAGIFIGVVFENIFLIPVLIIFSVFTPLMFLLFKKNSFEKRVTDNMELSLSLITNSYKRGGNFTRAVSDNLFNFKKPFKKIFEAYLAKAQSSSEKEGLLFIRNMTDRAVYKEWIDTVILSLENADLKNLLFAYIKQLSDERQLAAELSLKIYDPLKEFIVMCGFCIVNYPLLYFLNRDWFFTLIHSIPGKVIMAITVFFMLLGLFKIIRISRMVTYGKEEV
jgi:Flp pilus assembly protein TadB